MTEDRDLAQLTRDGPLSAAALAHQTRDGQYSIGSRSVLKVIGQVLVHAQPFRAATISDPI